MYNNIISTVLPISPSWRSFKYYRGRSKIATSTWSRLAHIVVGNQNNKLKSASPQKEIFFDYFTS